MTKVIAIEVIAMVLFSIKLLLSEKGLKSAEILEKQAVAQIKTYSK